jgi:hypothetical protein
VRTFAAAALISIAVHTAAVAFAPRGVTPVAHPHVAAAAIPEPAPEPEPVVIELLDEATTAALAGESLGVPQAAAPGPAHEVATISTGRASGTATASAEQPAPAVHSPLMTMRHREADKGMSSDFVDEFLAHSKPLVRGPDVAGEQVREDLAALDARLHDREHVENADPIAIQNERIARDRKAQEIADVELHPSGNGTYSIEDKQFGAYTARVARDGTVAITDKRNLQVDGVLPIGILGHFDATDWVMRSHGADPYAAAKRAFLERTRDQRVEIGRRDRKDKLKQAPALMQEHLARLWSTIADPTERKQTLFALWDECADTGDEELVAAADGARQMVVGFIHAKQIAYSSAELAALNAHRQSKSAFAP